jgi:hypothetical protein
MEVLEMKRTIFAMSPAGTVFLSARPLLAHHPLAAEYRANTPISIMNVVISQESK